MLAECGSMNTQHENANPLMAPSSSLGMGNGYHRPGPMGDSEAPTRRKNSRKPTLLIGAALFLFGFLVVAGFVGIRYGREWLNPKHNEVIWYPAQTQALEVTVVEKGTLEAAKNEDLKCLVKATRGGQFATTIRWVIDDGTQVMANRPEDQRANVRGDWVWPHSGKIPKTARNGKPPTK